MNNPAINTALKEYEELKDKCTRDDIIVVFDMSQPSYQKRLYVVDIKTQTIVRSHHAAHGKNSSLPTDRSKAIYFSNHLGSYKSSDGAMVTSTTYYGKHGYSLKLKGLRKGINDNVERRHIVIHPANYVTNKYIKNNGRAGQSHGCPAVDPKISESLINLIKGGVFFYAYSGQ